MQSFPSLRHKAEAEEARSRSGHASTSSLDLRKVATSAVADAEESGQGEGGDKLRRRYSAGNLRQLSEQEKQDDTDENMFSMDEEQQPSDGDNGGVKSVVPTYAQARQNWAERCYEMERSKRHADTIPPTVTTTQENGTTRTEWFLLIENLTKNMIRPCVLDLKMGTRQYGCRPCSFLNNF